MLTFDEFRAVSNREKMKSANALKINKKKSTESNNTLPAPVKKTFTIIDSIGEFLELHQMQSIYVILVVADVFASLAKMCISCGSTVSLAANEKIASRLLSSFSSFCFLFFAVEIIAVATVFGSAMFTHWGYLLDVFTTVCQLYLELFGYGKFAQLLNLFRFWRMVRLLNSMVSAEKDAYYKILSKLELSETEVKSLQTETANLRSDITKEKEARDSIESMLLNYKEEVDTLNEALKIAAMDIAEVAQGDDEYALSEVDDDDDDDEDNVADNDSVDHARGNTYYHKAKSSGVAKQQDDNEEIFVDAATSKFSKANNKSTVMRAVMEDAVSTYSRSSTLTNLTGNISTGPPTFVVHEDGTFEQK